MPDAVAFQLENGTRVLVETTELSLDPGSTASDLGLPQSAEPTSIDKHLAKYTTSLREMLEAVVASIESTMQSNAPDEWGVELSVGFVGKASPVPVLLSSEASGALKVHAKWSRQDK